jgi:hypothetical protein
MVTTAKASLISQRSTLSTLQPFFASSFFMAPTGAVVNRPGSWAKVLWPTRVATGLAPSFAAVEARIMTSAAAPSEIDEELAGVTVPSLRKAGFRPGSFPVGLEGLLVLVDITSPFLPDTVTGAISQAKLPSVLACLERVVEAMEKASCASRREFVAAGAVLGEGAHQAALVVGVFQAVEEHVVLDLAVAEAEAAARLGQEVGRVGHRLHAAGDHDVDAAGQQHVVGVHRRAHARAAHLVHRGAAGRQRQAGAEAAWRAGAWPWPAGSTQPMITSSTCSGLRPARSTAALMATLPSWAQVSEAKSP